jgi:hypothetical protein
VKWLEGGRICEERLDVEGRWIQPSWHPGMEGITLIERR